MFVISSLNNLNNEINGRWFAFLWSLIQLFRQRKRNKTNRVVIHDVWKDNVRDAGILPFPHEWHFDSPHQTKSEDILIYGVNSSKQSLKIEIKLRTKSDDNKRKANISLRFDDNEGNYYTLEEESDVERRDKEYKVCGLTVEIFSPFKRKSIRFRGYLTKNGSQLVYIRFRFLWTAISRVYDFTHDFDDVFMAKEWTQCKEIKPNQRFEDRIEQFGQIKGTFNEENKPEKVVYLWGAISKKYLNPKPINRRIIRVIGYNKEGIGFHLGLISSDNFEYRFGFLFDKKQRFRKLKSISLEKSDFEEILAQNNSNLRFKAIFDENEYKFIINANEKNLAHQITINGNPGMCYILEEFENEFQENPKLFENPSKDMSLVLGLNEENAKSVELSGGKGSSLAVLMNLTQKPLKDNNENKFNVPNGIVVTTNAYQRLLDENKSISNKINALENATQLSKDELRNKCQNLMNSISNEKLPQIIGKEIENKLKENFNDFENKLFAVRSSGASEDSEEMSTAGQMSSYLGVKGLEEIKESVMKCWSSQFSHIAVEYKRGYGQPINSLMAVVIQEMVDCESAGVMFTCDPISGDERIIEITANYGLGESVVSASSEPDTIRMNVNIESNSLSNRRTIAGFDSKVIGAKKTLIKLSEEGGTLEEEVFDREKCCINDEDLTRLGDLGLRIHRHYGNARDIEWGLKRGQIFMLQSRPVTNLDNFTDYEMMHEMDSSHSTESEIYSRAHMGENFPGSASWFVFTWTLANKFTFFRNFVKQGLYTVDDYNPYNNSMGIRYNQLMFDMNNGFATMFADYPESNASKHMVLAFFGHHIEDEDVLNAFKRFRNTKKSSFLSKIKLFFGFVYNILMGPTNLIKTKTQFMDQMKYNMIDKIKDKNTSKDILEAISSEYSMVSVVQFENHGPCSFGSTMKNMILRSALEGAQKNNPHLEEDYNLLISSCNDVISAEVPNALRDIALSIKDKKHFIQMSDKEVIQLLKDGSDESSHKFRHFLERHGHRGYREMDPMCLSWAEDPTPCVKTIKGMLLGNESQLIPKVDKSVDDMITELKTPLGFIRKLLIKKVLLPWSRRGVGYRELSKYFVVWINDSLKQGSRFLANKMVSEGLIPNVETFYFLTSEEVERLCNGDRDPMINMRARLRKRVHPKMNKYKFEEFIKGPEMKPRNFAEQIIATNLSNDSLRMSGTPISSGTVKARVCVAEDISEADNIQSGDILITYSTDIGWSPYFPLLSGIVTEIGGTISHGAVIAREYGIPSLIAVEGVCRVFKTGDICVLDTHSATITKVG